MSHFKIQFLSETKSIITVVRLIPHNLFLTSIFLSYLIYFLIFGLLHKSTLAGGSCGIWNAFSNSISAAFFSYEYESSLLTPNYSRSFLIVLKSYLPTLTVSTTLPFFDSSNLGSPSINKVVKIFDKRGNIYSKRFSYRYQSGIFVSIFI